MSTDGFYAQEWPDYLADGMGVHMQRQTAVSRYCKDKGSNSGEAAD